VYTVYAFPSGSLFYTYMLDSHQREKRLLQDEIVQLKKEKELLDRSLVNKDAEIIDIHKQLEASNSAVRTDENKIRLLETQVTDINELSCFIIYE
jgi:predicted  nucleic acid-binding Zn-ribbon protein